MADTDWGDDTPSKPDVGYAEDVGKGFVGGLGRGTAGTIGLPGTLGGLVRTGLSKAGVGDETLNTAASVMRRVPYLNAFTGPSGQDVQKALENYTGKFYEPQTVPGQYASTIGEFAPAAVMPGGGGLVARGVNTLVPAITSETAGQLTKGTVAEPYARGAAGLVAGPAAARAITPVATVNSPMRQAALTTLEREGIPLTAGQRTGNKALQWAEANAADMPGSARRAAEMRMEQAAAYDRAITERMFERGQLTQRGVPADVNLPDPRVVTAGRQSLSDEYTRLSGANQLTADRQLMRDMLNVEREYARNVLPSQRAGGSRDIMEIRNDIANRLLARGGSMPGDQYQSIRSRLGTQARAVTNDPYLQDAFRGYRTALDEAMQRGLTPADAAAWRLNNQRWANMRQLEGAVSRAGENLSPKAVAQQARVGRQAQYAARSGSLDELASAADLVLKPMPNSGTAQRLGAQKLFNLPAWMAAGTGGAAGSLLGPVGAAIGAVTPFAASKFILSGPGQRYLANQALPQRTRNILAQETVQQQISPTKSTPEDDEEWR